MPKISVAVAKRGAAQPGRRVRREERSGGADDGVIDARATQDEVFERVAEPVVDSVLEGFNGTIFAYGQTGSGKTFTLTGGVNAYTERGIIPRVLAALFARIQANTEAEHTVRVSYLEIYNENGFDLLDPRQAAAAGRHGSLGHGGGALSHAAAEQAHACRIDEQRARSKPVRPDGAGRARRGRCLHVALLERRRQAQVREAARVGARARRRQL